MQDLIGDIYEAAALPERWPALLQGIADALGSRGAVTVVGGGDRQQPDWLASPGFERDMHDYAAAGWLQDSEYAAPLFKNIPPGFTTPLDYYAREALERVPVYAQFMRPRGLIGAAGTIVQGDADRIVQLSFEGFADHATARSAIPRLNDLRPHFARALSMSAALSLGRARSTVDVLTTVGIAAAVIDPNGRVAAWNSAFDRHLGEEVSVVARRLRFRDVSANDLFRRGLLAPANGNRGCSFVARRGSVDEAVAMHLLPLASDARDLFGATGHLLIAVRAANASVPGADLLRLMFDLTPAEARLVRALVAGMPLGSAAADIGIRESTARVHLRSVFRKTGVSRQADLVRTLAMLPEEAQIDAGTERKKAGFVNDLPRMGDVAGGAPR